jgi:hypothetical protein
MATRRPRRIAALLALFLVPLAPATAAGPPPDRSLQALQWMGSAACRAAARSATSDPEQCAAIDGRPVSEARIVAYQGTWVHKALTLQRGLARGAPLTEAVIPHTHNSFNSSAYDIPASPPSLTNQDPNQPYSIRDQLRMDVRAIEIDVHWVPSVHGAATGGFEVVACHGTRVPSGTPPNVHVGCTDDRPFTVALQEVRRWLDDNPGEFLLVYLENQLDGSATAHDRAAQVIDSVLGPLVYKPPLGQPCAPMPVDTSAASITQGGARVLIVGNCGPGAWGQWVHERQPRWDESGNPTGYGAVACAGDLRKRATGPAPFLRYFEDRTWLTSAIGSPQTISPDGTAQMVRCGVNIVGFDQLTPEDLRLAASVWSWAENEPAMDGCAYQDATTRFRASACGAPAPARHFACRDASGGWHVSAATGAWSSGAAACPAEFVGSTFAVPPNGWRNKQLADAKTAAGDEVWLAYRGAGLNWQ